MTLARKRPSRLAWRAALVASALLLCACVVLAHLVARELPRPRVDLSQDQLFGLHGSTRALVAKLEDVLSVEAYFTGEVRHGSVQLAKGRLLDQLRDIDALARGRVEIETFDPSASSEARLAAEKEGLTAVPLRGQQGTAQVTQNIWLGLVLRYQGRTRAIPFVLPQAFEFAFAEALADLLRERRPRIGFLVERAGDSGGDGFSEARALLSRRAQLVEVSGLSVGKPVPEGTDLLIVAAPDALVPRAVFEIDQYAQRGGRVLLWLERQRADLSTVAVRELDTGLEDVLRAWGIPLSKFVVWDSACHEISARQANGSTAKLEFPPFVDVGETGMSAAVPATGRLNGCDLWFANAFGPEPDGAEPRAPAGVERIDLIQSSARSWFVDPKELHGIDATSLNELNAELLATGHGRARPLAVSLRGRLPSPFASSGAPRPLLPGGAADPSAGPTGEPVLSGAHDAQIVAIGDADFARTRLFGERNQLLLSNLIDWLTLEGELVALRARMPRERKIVDFLDAERSARGLSALVGSTTSSDDASRTRAEQQAADVAAARRWKHMGTAAAGTLGLLALAVLARRATRASAGGLA